MKRNKLILLSLPMLLATTVVGCAKDNRTIQEKVLGNIGDTLAITGEYTMGQKISMQDPVSGETKVEDMSMGSSTYTTYLCPDFIQIAQDIETEDYHYELRIDKDDKGLPVIYQLDPFKNEVVATSWTGDETTKFQDVFTNPFVNPDNFDVEDNTLVLKEESDFDFESLSYVLTLGNSATKLKTFTIDFTGKNKPYSFYAEFVDDRNSQFGFETYFKYSGTFIEPKSVNVSPVPTAVAQQAGQDLLEAKFASLRNLNYTATTTIYEGETKVTDAIVRVNPSHIYFEYANVNPEYSDMNLVNRGYFQDENGVNYYKLKEGVPTATSQPNTKVTYTDLVGNCWKISGYVFNVNKDGSYSLPDYEFSAPVNYYLGTESLFVGGLQVDKGSFSVTLTDSGLNYTYTSDARYKVVTSVSNVGSTTIPVDLDQFVEYAPATNILEWGERQMVPQLDFVVNDITDNHSELIPFYEGTGRNDGFIDVGTWKMEQFGAGFTIAQQCSNEMEEMELFMNFMNQIQEIDGYTYHLMDDEYEYGSEGDDVHFTVSITPGMYTGVMTGVMYEHAVTLKVVNLATPDGWVNPWDEM